MAVFRINATRAGTLVLPNTGEPWVDGLTRALAEVPTGAPVCVLIHGYRFTWRPDVGRGFHNPQRRLYSTKPVPEERRIRPFFAAWPHGLGFTHGEPRDGHAGTQPGGLCIAFGWDGRRPTLATLAARGRNDFALVYEAAAFAGTALATLLQRLQALRPDLAIDFVTHSLGARVAFCALSHAPDLRCGRAILLGAAEYVGEAQHLLSLTQGSRQAPEFVHVLSRANDLYDTLFEMFAPAPRQPSDRVLGVAGIGAPHARWLDLQLDHPTLAPWLADRGIALERTKERMSHWHFYADPGAMALWSAMLRERERWSLQALRRHAFSTMIEPRWARLMPTRPRLPKAVPTLPEPEADFGPGDLAEA